MSQRVEGSTEIQRPVAEVYGYWETLENLPQFMKNVEEVHSTGPDLTQWKVKGPFGASLVFDARTTEKERNSAIGWNTVDGDVGTSGEVRFSEIGPQSTRVDVVMNYSDPPGGKLGERVSRIIADPQFMLAQDLENLRDILEGKATPEEIQQRAAAAGVQGGVIAFLTSGAGIALLAGIGLVLILRRLSSKGKSSTEATDSDRKFRFIVEF